MRDLAPIDVAVLPVGGWGPRLPSDHLNPLSAAKALELLRPPGGLRAGALGHRIPAVAAAGVQRQVGGVAARVRPLCGAPHAGGRRTHPAARRSRRCSRRRRSGGGRARGARLSSASRLSAARRLGLRPRGEPRAPCSPPAGAPPRPAPTSRCSRNCGAPATRSPTATSAAGKSHSIAPPSTWVVAHAELAAELSMAVAVTSISSARPAGPRNTVSLFDRFGREALTYAKVHTCSFTSICGAMIPHIDRLPVIHLPRRSLGRHSVEATYVNKPTFWFKNQNLGVMLDG